MRETSEFSSMLTIIIGGIILLVIILRFFEKRAHEDMVWGEEFKKHMEKRNTEMAMEKNRSQVANEHTRLSPEDLSMRETLRKKAESGSKEDFLRYAIWLDTHKQYQEAMKWYKKRLVRMLNLIMSLFQEKIMNAVLPIIE